MSEPDILRANRAFYDAFVARDVDRMGKLWARRHGVACIHPGWEALHGRDAVMASWRAILGSSGSPRVRASEETVILLGDVALVTCVERVGGGELVATNIFVLEDEEWRLVHHHTSPFARTSGPPSKRSIN